MQKSLHLILIMLYFTGCSMVISKIVPFNNLPAPTGKYAVGTKIFYWTDESRDEWFTEDDLTDKRRLVVQIWYPTDETVNERYHPYVFQAEERLEPLSYQIGLPVFFFKHIQDVETNSIYNAKLHPDITEAPLIIFSHGLGGMKHQSSAHVEELVSHGYIVVAPDHAFDANLTIFEDGSIADFRSGLTYLQYKKGEGVEITEQDFWDFRLPQIRTRAADISFIIDQIEKKQSEGYVWSSIKMDRIGIFGHSYGGATGVMSAYGDNRIAACIALDGWMVPIPKEVIYHGMDIPFLYIGREKWEDSVNYQNLDTLIQRSSKVANKLILDKTNHFDYTDTPHFSPMTHVLGLSGEMSNEDLLDTLNSQITSFFDKHIK